VQKKQIENWKDREVNHDKAEVLLDAVGKKTTKDIAERLRETKITKDAIEKKPKIYW
jgi:hypothetical protein